VNTEEKGRPKAAFLLGDGGSVLFRHALPHLVLDDARLPPDPQRDRASGENEQREPRQETHEIAIHFVSFAF